MINTVYNLLKPLNIPVQYMLRPEINSTNKTGISYHFFNEGYLTYGDGKGEEFGGSLQVDVFSTVDYSGVVKQIINTLEKCGFRFADGRDTYDSLNSNVQYYQKTMIFNFVERMVQK
jgi:hypothetical protein